MISIIIPTKNDKNNLKRLFKSLDKISNQIEVIVVDSNSNDGTEEFINSISYATYIREESTAGKARNIGIKNSSHEIIALLDSDVEITDSWLPALLDSMCYADIVSGYSPDPKYRDMPRVSIIVDGQDITYPQCNIAYRRSVFHEVGFLREDMIIAEDCEFHYRCVKAGKVIIYNPRMKVFHYERHEISEWIRKCIKNGFGRHELEGIHPSLKHQSQHSLKIKNFFRLIFAALGYLKGKLVGGKINPLRKN